MKHPDGPAVLCIASYEKGQATLRELDRLGCNVVLLTAEKLRNAPWPFENLSELHTMGNEATPEQVLRQVQSIARRVRIQRVVPLDEFDLEAAALVREELRLPGMGQSVTRHFRDKLAMRFAAQNAGIAVPPFAPVLNYDDLREFMRTVPAPWLIKPRTSASAIGIRMARNEAEVWKTVEELGDRQADYLIERYLPGEVFHVDSVTWQGSVVAQAVHQYGAPPMSLMQQGGVFTTRTLPRESAESQQLRALDAKLLPALGMTSGVTHTEFIRAAEDGRFYFLETAARVGGAFIAELVEFSSGLNPWVEWARIEAALAMGHAYSVPVAKEAYAGSVICLARQEHPDLSAYSDPEVVYRVNKRHHAGLIVQSPSAARILELVSSYEERFSRDFQATLPPPDKPTS